MHHPPFFRLEGNPSVNRRVSRLCSLTFLISYHTRLSQKCKVLLSFRLCKVFFRLYRQNMLSSFRPLWGSVPSLCLFLWCFPGTFSQFLPTIPPEFSFCHLRNIEYTFQPTDPGPSSEFLSYDALYRQNATANVFPFCALCRKKS